MKRWLLHIWLMGVLGMLAASCSQDADELALDTTSSGTVRIQFSLAMDESRAGSRAAWGTTTTTTGYRVVGDTYENMIDLSKLQVFLFQGTTYLGEVGGLTLTPNSSSTTYTFTGEVTVNGVNVTTDANGNKTLANTTIMVTANYDGYVNGNVAVTYNYLFDYIADAYNPTATNKKYIPMWGMLKPSTGIPLNPEGTAANDFTNIGDIYMLRSMAKIEVQLTNTLLTNGYKITSAKLNKYNQEGYLLPAKYPSSTNGVAASYFNTTSTSYFDTEGCTNPVSGKSLVADLPFSVSNNGGSCIIYVPEYANDGTLGITLGLTNNGTDITDKIESNVIWLNNYGSDGKPINTYLNLVRNHWYRYTINSISDGYQLALTCVVQDWSDADVEEWDFTDQVSLGEGGKLVFGTMSGDTFTANATQTKEVVTTGGELVCQFHIATPTESTWQAEFIATDSESNNAFVFVSDNGTESATATGNVGEKATLVIKPANTNIDQNKSALLRISVRTKEGRTIVVKDLLPDDLGVNEYTITHSK